MSSDDTTTKPTIETVLERISQLGDRLSGEISLLRADITKALHQLERKVDLLNRDFLSIRAQQEDQLERIEKLEGKVS